MHNHRVIFVVSVLSAVSPALAAEFGAVDTARRYSAALVNGDCETIYALTSPRLIVRDQVPNQTRDMLCQLSAEMKRNGLAETMDPPRASLDDGMRRLVIIPAHRTTGPVLARTVTDLDYVVHSNDGGKTWKVLDLGCVDERWVREIYPAYSGEPPIRAATVRELGVGKHDR
jgi:hypothetical protein